MGEKVLIEDSQNNKAAIRSEILAKRKAQTVIFQKNIAQKFADFVEHSSLFDPNKIIAFYWPIHSELDTRPAMALLHNKGSKLALPAIIAENIMEFRQFRHQSDLKTMAFGTKGPKNHCLKIDPDIIILPLSAFDKRGNRIGYGGGYYDRAIAKLQQKGLNPLLIGLAFDCQHVEKIKNEAHDIPLNMVWTESGLFIC